jgi:hypothetical protein
MTKQQFFIERVVFYLDRGIDLDFARLLAESDVKYAYAG